MTGVTLDDLLAIDRETTPEEEVNVPKALTEDDDASWSIVEKEHKACADPKLKRRRRRGETYKDIVARGLNQIVCKTPGVSDQIVAWGRRRSGAILAKALVRAGVVSPGMAPVAMAILGGLIVAMLLKPGLERQCNAWAKDCG